VGAKTAAVLLAHFGSLDALLERMDEVGYLRFRGAAACALKLREHGGKARLYRRLTRIALDAPGASAVDTLRRQNDPQNRLDALCDQLRFGAFTRSRLRSLLR
jgi:DNA polymerase-1